MVELIHHPDTHRLGKLDAKPPHAMLEEFVDFEKAAATIEVPVNVINSALAAHPGVPMAIALAMYLNDQQGCCTCAGVGNTLRVNSDGTIEITDGDVETGYEAVTGEEGAAFSPGPPPVNDNGCVELDVLDFWVATGFGPDKLLGHAGVDMTKPQQVKMACYLTGSLYTGDQLAVAQQSQQIWDYVPGSPAWGGHCPPTVDIYDSTPAGLVIGGAHIPTGSQIDVAMTWADYKATTRAFRSKQCDEGHALMTDAWLAKVKADPVLSQIVDVAKLEAYFKTLQPES